MTAKFYPAFLFPLGILLSAIETLICCREMSLIGSTSFGFAQNTWFSKYRIELIVALSLTNATKINSMDSFYLFSTVYYKIHSFDSLEQ